MKTYGKFAGIPAVVSHQTTLNPLLWNTEDNTLKANVKNAIESMAHKFIKKLGLPVSAIEDLRIVGGNSSYDWNENSDIDVSIMLDRNKSYSKKEVRTLGLATSLLNYKLSPSINGIDLNFYISSKNLGGLRPARQSIYSFSKGEHIVGPYNSPEMEPNYVTGKANYFSDLIENCIQDEDSDRGECAKVLLQKLKAFRAKGLASKSGEASTPNLVWRLLSRSGYIGILKNKVEEIEKNYFQLSTEGPRSIVSNDEYRQYVALDRDKDIVPMSVMAWNKRLLQGQDPSDMLNRVKPILGLFADKYN